MTFPEVRAPPHLAAAKTVMILLAMVFLLASLPSAVHAQSVVGPSTSTNSIRSGSRQSFFDTVGGNHWQFWFNGTGIEYASSGDGATWTSRGTLPYQTSNFSVTNKVIGGTSYLFIASETNCPETTISSSSSSSSSSNSSESSSSDSYDSSSSDWDDSSSSDSYYSSSSDSYYSSSSDSYYSSSSDSYYSSSSDSYYSSSSDSYYSSSSDSYYSSSSDSYYSSSSYSYYSSSSDSYYSSSSDSYYSSSSDSYYSSSSDSYYSSSSDGYYSSYGNTSPQENLPLTAPGHRCEIQVIKGTISGTSLSFASAVPAFTLGDSTSEYTKPSISLDSANHLWVAAIKDLGLSAGEHLKVIATRSVNPATNALEFAIEQSVSRPLPVARAVSIVPLNSGKMLLALSGEGTKRNIETYQFDGSSWREITAGGEFGWSLSSATGNMDVLAIARGPNGALYVGGYFTTAGSTTASNIAMWDGASWTALGSGVTGTTNNGQVQALAVDSQGNLFAGGWFTTAGGASANYIAKWDGNTWSSLGSGLNSAVNALAVDSNDVLYAGGSFTMANGAPAQYVAKWNGSAWSALGSGLSSIVRALTVKASGELVAGGDFYTAGGSTVKYIAEWNGTTWHGLGTGANVGTNSSVYALSTGPNGTVYAAGNFTSAGGVATNRLAQWNGTTWSPLGSGVDAAVQTLTVDGEGNVYTGGSFSTAGGNAAAKVAKWDGSSWSALGSGVSVTPNVIALDANGSLFVGASDGTSNANLFAWNGDSWQAVVNGFDGAVRNIAIDSLGRVYIAGNFTKIGSMGASRVAMWDGTSWSPLGSGMTSTSGTVSVATLAFDTSGNLYAGGTFTHAGGVSANNIAVWNGASWSAVGAGTNASVSALAVDTNNNLYAGGSFTMAGGISASRVAKWDGTSWSALGAGTGGGLINYVYALAAAPNGDIYVGGYFTSAGGVTANNIAKWDGSTWSTLGTGCNSYVRGITLAPNGNLYAMGAFITAGGITVNRVAMWDGSSWNALGSGLSSAELTGTLALGPNGELYAAGAFTTAGGVSANRVAVWNGTSWSAVGSGIPHSVYSMALHPNGSIYAGTFRSFAYGRLVTAADTGTSSVTSLVPGANGTAHLLYTDSNKDIQIRTFSESPPTWSSAAPVHLGSVTSVTGTLYSPTQKLISWFIDGGEVLSRESTSPYTSWSAPNTVSSTGNPKQVSSYPEATGYAILLATWNRTGASVGEVVAATTTMPTTPTPTTTPTATPTATPSVTPPPPPTISPPPPPGLAIGLPQDAPRRGPVVVSPQAVTLSGTGIPGHSIEIQVDGIVVGTAIVRASGALGIRTTSGVWEFKLPPLATGTREITTVSIDEIGNRSAPSEATKLVVLDVAPLDFTGTGESAITTFARVGDKMRFKTRAVSDSSWRTAKLTGRYPAAADYDNDGITDLAAVAVSQGKLQWNIKLSSTGTTASEIVGELGDTILSGCRFAPGEGSVLASFDSQKRELSFRTYNNPTKRIVKIAKLSRGDLLGCGDTDGDAKDEILFRVRGARKQSSSVAAFDTNGNRRLLSEYNQFLRGFVVRRAGTQVPLVAVLGGTTHNGRQVRITTMAGTFAFPLFHISRNATIGTGIFTNEANQQISGLFWSDNSSGMVYRRLLTRDVPTVPLFKLPDGFRLIRSQSVIRTERPQDATVKK